MTAPLLIRPLASADLPAVTDIYAWNVHNGTGTFEIDPPDAADMAQRHAALQSLGLPWLVAQRGAQVVGYAYANRFRPREAFRFCVEDSVYLAPECRGQGVGRLLLTELISRSEAAGATQMIAVIGDSDNLASIAVHRSLGFQPAGILAAVGWKFDRWLDVVLMQRSLGSGQGRPPRIEE